MVDETVAAIIQDLRDMCEEALARAREQSDGLHPRPVEEALDETGGFAQRVRAKVVELNRAMKRAG